MQWFVLSNININLYFEMTFQVDYLLKAIHMHIHGGCVEAGM